MGGYEGPGRYRHYKGGEYEVVGLGLTEDRHLRTVVYKPVDPWPDDVPPADFWLRPLIVFNDTVDYGPEGNEGLHKFGPRFVKLKCEDCHGANLERVESDLNTVDWSFSGSRQGYQVYRCKECGDYWGCRFQHDPGTGADDRWHRFGSEPPTRRHY